MSTLLSGGAVGADSLFAVCAEHAGHKIYEFTFIGHQAATRPTAYVLNTGQLEDAAKTMGMVGESLKRKFNISVPNHMGLQFKRNLLLRNYYQILGIEESGPTERVYAITRLSKDKTQAMGGTAWAIELAAKFSHDPAIFLFDMNSNRWYTWVEERFEPCGEPPGPSGVYTGIGSRDMTEAGIEALGSLYHLPLGKISILEYANIRGSGSLRRPRAPKPTPKNGRLSSSEARYRILPRRPCIGLTP